MKKLFMFICVSVVGIAAGGVYWLYKKEKIANNATESVVNGENFESKKKKKKNPHELNVVEDLQQAKDECAQVIYERHSEASKIMKDAYSNIMEDFVEDFSDEKNVNWKDKNKEIINDEAVADMKELDSISDEVDDLLK